MQHSGESNLSLKAGEGGADAEMDAEAETEMPSLLTRNLKPIRLCKMFRIAIGSPRIILTSCPLRIRLPLNSTSSAAGQ